MCDEPARAHGWLGCTSYSGEERHRWKRAVSIADDQVLEHAAQAQHQIVSRRPTPNLAL